MEQLEKLMHYFQEQGAPEDQQMLIALLREAQELDGGALFAHTLSEISAALDIRPSMLQALIRRIPSLCPSDSPHRLELCRTCGRSRDLARFIEENFHVQPGGICRENGFSYRLTNCMKNCRCGPSMRWDGKLYSQANEALILELTQKGN